MSRSVVARIHGAHRQHVDILSPAFADGLVCLSATDAPVILNRDAAAELINALACAFAIPVKICADMVVSGVDWQRDQVEGHEFNGAGHA